MNVAIAPGSGSWVLDTVATLPPLLKLLAYLIPVVVFVSWGPWAWVLGTLLAMFAAAPMGTDGIILGGLVGGGIGYVLNCRWNPMANCWWCKGSPKRRDKQTHFHWCFICGGAGRRWRLGSQAWPKFREKAAEGR